MLSEAPGAVGRQEGSKTGQAAWSGHGHVSRVTCDVSRVTYDVLSLRLTEFTKLN